MELLKGAPVSAAIRAQVEEELARIKGPAPRLAVIRVGAVSYTHLTLPTTERV